MEKFVKLPFVTANMAISLDGKISDRNFRPARFTSDDDLKRLLELRLGAGALIVGKGTLEADNMRMTVPDSLLEGADGPLRCVISRNGNWDRSHPAFKIDYPEMILFRNTLDEVEPGEIGVKSISQCLKYLAARGVKRVHCEGGGELLSSFISEGLLDELYLTWAAGAIIGGESAPTLTGRKGARFISTEHFELKQMEVSSQGECYLCYRKIESINKSQ